MTFTWVVAQTASGELLIRTPEGAGYNKTRPACTVVAACRTLRRSRRHLYRYIRDGVLKPYGKFLGEWLLDPREVRRLAQLPHGLKSPPKHSQTLFPEYDARKLNPYRDRRLIMGRVLDRGDRRELAWIFKRYPAPEIRNFLVTDGPRLLSPKSQNFWSLYFKVPSPMIPETRKRARRLGGAP